MFSAFLNFDTFIFPKIVKVIYWIGMVLIALGTLFGAFASLFMSADMNGMGGGGATGIVGFLAVLIGGTIGAIVWRVTIELWLVLFSILETLKQIRDQRGAGQ